MPESGHLLFFFSISCKCLHFILQQKRRKEAFKLILKFIIVIALLFSGSANRIIIPNKGIIDAIICPGPGCKPN